MHCVPLRAALWSSVALIFFSGIAAGQTSSSITGQIRYYGTGAAVSGVSVNLIGPMPSTTVTDANGMFSFTNLVTGDWRVEPEKNGDERSSLTAFDASIELQCSVGLVVCTAQQRLACDTNASSSLTAIDASYILQYRVGIISALPVSNACGSNWAFVPTPLPTAGQTLIAPQPNATPALCQPGAIEYSNLNGSASSQDFTAILFGDCNGNWPNVTATPTPSTLPAATSTFTPSPSPSLTMSRTNTPTRTPTPSRTITPTMTPTLSPISGLPWPTISFGTTYSGLSAPVYVKGADNADGATRTFVVLQGGVIRLIKNGVLQATAFLDIGSGGANRISCCGERGLLSVAFPPGYASKRYFYIYYTNTLGNLVIARYHLSVSNDVADVNSEEIILTVPHTSASNHNGGQLQFGPDGYLYIGTGDGGGGGDPDNNAQNSTVLLGKILRIDVETTVPTPTPYLIPNSNPTPNPSFTQTPGYRHEIWAMGVRNPWRFSFDRSTGDLYIGEVGQGAWEEVDFQPAASGGGQNYGWRLYEGNHPYDCGTCDQTGLTFPVLEYSHASGDCSITGGYVYRGPGLPCSQGTYFYADYCTGRMWGARHSGSVWQSQLLIDNAFNITCFGEDLAGNLYVCDPTNSRILMVADSCMP